jgi:hypothetical protein
LPRHLLEKTKQKYKWEGSKNEHELPVKGLPVKMHQIIRVVVGGSDAPRERERERERARARGGAKVTPYGPQTE